MNQHFTMSVYYLTTEPTENIERQNSKKTI